MLASDPDSSWFRIANASVIMAARPALTYRRGLDFSATDIESEISRLSSQFGGAPHVYRLVEMHGFPKATIATFGGVGLQQLKPNDLAVWPGKGRRTPAPEADK